VNCRLLVLAIMCVSCMEPSPEVEPCFVCSELEPFSQPCESQVGQVLLESNAYYCNLYFGESRICESVETCCDRVNGRLDDVGVCDQVRRDAGSDES
jgi:hypothetical protein